MVIFILVVLSAILGSLAICGPVYLIIATFLAPVPCAIAVGHWAAQHRQRQYVRLTAILTNAGLFAFISMIGNRWLVDGVISAFIGAGVIGMCVSVLVASIAYNVSRVA